jgi:ribose/xylose/arabinose/galactoside ABC-type transport system permease subunit
MIKRFKIDQGNLTIVATVALFMALFALGSVLYPGFFSLQVFLKLLIDNAYLIIVATGMAFVIISGGIDLSVGALVALVSMVSASLLAAGMNPYFVMCLVLILGVVFGFFQGSLICRFDLHPWIVTLGGMFLARGFSYLISTESIAIDNPVYVGISQFRFVLPGGSNVSIGVVIALLVVSFAVYVSKYSAFGRNVFAVGGNESSAQLMGLPVVRTKIAVYVLSGFCSALGGLVFTFYMLSGYALHLLGMEMDAIAACVIGGILLTGGFGYLIGPLFGVLSIGVIQTLIIFQGTLSSWWTKIAVGFLLFAFIVLQRAIVTSNKARLPLLSKRKFKHQTASISD